MDVPPAPEPEAASLGPSEPPPTAGPGEKRRWRDRLPRDRFVRVLLVLVVLWIPGRLAVEFVNARRENPSEILKEHPILSEFDVAGAQTALAKVLAAENEYFAEHDSYTALIWWELSDPDFTVPGVTIELGSYVHDDQHIGAVTADTADDRVYLNARAGTKQCFYIFASSPTDVQTAEEEVDGYGFCPISFEVQFSGQEWAIPEA